LVPSQCSREIKIVCPLDLAPLIVSGRREAQPDLLSGCFCDWKEEAPIELVAVAGIGIDLVRRVWTFAKAFPSAPCRIAAHHNDIVVSGSPLTLDAPELRAQVKDHVVATTLGYWAINLNTKLQRCRNDASLGDGSFLIRCHA
jgi:hypothetical protein